MAKTIEEKRRQAAEASRRWREKHPERAKQVERDAYHRRQAKEGNESAERVAVSAEHKRDNARERQRKWREANRDRVNELRRNSYGRHAERERRAAREWAGKNKESQRALYLKRAYGLTVEQYEALGNRCGICGAEQGNANRTNGDGKPYRLHVDHCHDTGRIRGVLCINCNMGIGYFKHDIELLRKAIEYLG